MIKNYLKESKFIESIKKYKTPDTSIETLIEVFTLNLHRKDLTQDEILFRIDEVGDKFYIIIMGSVLVLKPKRVKKSMSPREFLQHLLEMKSNSEKYLLRMCVKSNYEKVCFKSFQDFAQWEETHFKQLIREFFVYTQKTDFENCSKIYEIFTRTSRKIEDYILIKNSNLEDMDYDSLKAYMLENENFLITKEEQKHYEKYAVIFSDNKTRNLYNTIEYQSVLELTSGMSFGDFALDSQAKRRTATIKASDNCILGYISNQVYSKYILQETFKIRQKDLVMLNSENFVFNSIRNYVFESVYFSKFSVYTYDKHEFIFKQGEAADKIYIIKEGEVDLLYSGSLLEANLMLQDLANASLQKEIFNAKQVEELKFLFYNKKVFEIRSESFLRKMHKKRKLFLTRLKAKDFLGVEPLLISSNHLYSAMVKSQKCQFFVLEKHVLDKILNLYPFCCKNFTELAKNKFNAYLHRLDNVKGAQERMIMENETAINDNLKVENLIKSHKKKLEKNFAVKIESQKVQYPETFVQEELRIKNAQVKSNKDLIAVPLTESLVNSVDNSSTFATKFNQKLGVAGIEENRFSRNKDMFMTQADKKLKSFDKNVNLNYKKEMSSGSSSKNNFNRCRFLLSVFY